MKASVYTLGCKINQYESMGIMGCLASRGFTVSGELEYADIFIINTCAVTQEAERKSRQTVTKIKKINPDALILVLGCGAQNDKSRFEQQTNVVWISGNADKAKAVEEFLETLETRKQNSSVINEFSAVKYLPSGFELPDGYKEDFKPLRTKTRAYIKVQDGCNNFCSYCIVPYLRGRSRSRTIKSIIRELESVCEKEVVLTGIDLSSYGRDLNTDLTALIKALPQDARRYRLGSLEPNVITDDFLKAVRDYNICEHFHLSMQSGSDRILKAMNRKYTAKLYLDKTGLIRKYFPLANITTDVIAGFPTETDIEHNETIQTVLKAEFGDMHVFPYSVRQGTEAALLKQTDKSVREQRAKELSEIAERMKADFLQKNKGQRAEVLTENFENGFMTGYTRNYIKVKLPADTPPDCIVETII